MQIKREPEILEAKRIIIDSERVANALISCHRDGINTYAYGQYLFSTNRYWFIVQELKSLDLDSLYSVVGLNSTEITLISVPSEKVHNKHLTDFIGKVKEYMEKPETKVIQEVLNHHIFRFESMEIDGELYCINRGIRSYFKALQEQKEIPLWSFDKDNKIFYLKAFKREFILGWSEFNPNNDTPVIKLSRRDIELYSKESR